MKKTFLLAFAIAILTATSLPVPSFAWPWDPGTIACNSKWEQCADRCNATGGHIGEAAYEACFEKCDAAFDACEAGNGGSCPVPNYCPV